MSSAYGMIRKTWVLYPANCGPNERNKWICPGDILSRSKNPNLKGVIMNIKPFIPSKDGSMVDRVVNFFAYRDREKCCITLDISCILSSEYVDEYFELGLPLDIRNEEKGDYILEKNSTGNTIIFPATTEWRMLEVYEYTHYSSDKKIFFYPGDTVTLTIHPDMIMYFANSCRETIEAKILGCEFQDFVKGRVKYIKVDASTKMKSNIRSIDPAVIVEFNTYRGRHAHINGVAGSINYMQDKINNHKSKM